MEGRNILLPEDKLLFAEPRGGYRTAVITSLPIIIYLSALQPTRYVAVRAHMGCR